MKRWHGIDPVGKEGAISFGGILQREQILLQQVDNAFLCANGHGHAYLAHNRAQRDNAVGEPILRTVVHRKRWMAGYVGRMQTVP